MFRSIRSVLYILFLFLLIQCSDSPPSGKPVASTTDPSYAVSSFVNDDPTSSLIPAITERNNRIKKVLSQPVPVLFLDSLDDKRALAQIIASSDPRFQGSLFDNSTGKPYLNEIFNIYPARPQEIPAGASANSIYRVEVYNYALNLTTVILVDINSQQVIALNKFPQSQPDLNKQQEELAIQIAINSPQVIEALGGKPGEKEALMASTKTALNKTRCERSMHLCVAPTFIKGDKALWAIVDLTDSRLIGILWTNVGTTGPAERISERNLLFEKIMECNCKEQISLAKNGWKMNYVLTSSDGLRISEVNYNGQPVLQSAKLVDWHVSYSGTDGFGYSDAVGCPEFSHAAVVAVSAPQVEDLVENGNTIGFVLEQSYQSEQWPRPCNYNYVQRYEFYNDGRFRVAVASLGRGCGNDGTYRPVIRIAFAGDRNFFSEWNGKDWMAAHIEHWWQQTEKTTYTKEGYQFQVSNKNGGYYVEPGRGQFKDGGRGDNAFVYVTKLHIDKDEGETDMVTIGPCCNVDYQQGPEKFIDGEKIIDEGEVVIGSGIVLWYVPQLKNDDAPGRQYCWAESILENGVYKTKAYPCMSGPLFVPFH